MYSVSCYINKVTINENGIASITIKPTGRSRVEGEDMRCLGFCKNKIAWLKLDVRIPKEIRDVILMARIYGKEVELVGKILKGQLIVKVITM